MRSEDNIGRREIRFEKKVWRKKEKQKQKQKD